MTSIQKKITEELEKLATEAKVELVGDASYTNVVTFRYMDGLKTLVKVYSDFQTGNVSFRLYKFPNFSGNPREYYVRYDDAALLLRFLDEIRGALRSLQVTG